MNKKELIQKLADVKSGKIKLETLQAALESKRGLEFQSENIALPTPAEMPTIEKGIQSAIQAASDAAKKSGLTGNEAKSAIDRAESQARKDAITQLFSADRVYFVRAGGIVSLPETKTRRDGRKAEFVPYYRTV